MRYLFSSVYCLCCLFVSTACPQDEVDLQHWNRGSFDFTLDGSSGLEGRILTEIRVIDSITNIADIRFGFGLRYSPNDSWTISPSFIYRRVRLDGARDRNEYRFVLNIEGVKEFEKFSFRNRSRFEHRIIDRGRDDKTFYRNRTQIRFPLKKNDKEIVTPFVQNGVWFEVQEFRFFRNEFRAGVRKRFNDIVRGSAFYNQRRDFQGRTRHQFVLGLTFRVKLD